MPHEYLLPTCEVEEHLLKTAAFDIEARRLGKRACRVRRDAELLLRPRAATGVQPGHARSRVRFGASRTCMLTMRCRAWAASSGARCSAVSSRACGRASRRRPGRAR